MAVTDTRSATRSSGERLVGPDVVRAVALIGVVLMNYHGYLILAGGERGDGVVDRFLDPWVGPLGTRFAATFVLVAGVSVTLFTRRAVGDRVAESARRWVLIRRGLLLYGVGLAFDLIWPGTILPFYGAMFVIAAGMFTWRSTWVALTGVGAAVAGAALAWWRLERRLGGHATEWMTNPPGASPRSLLLDVFVNGTHPLLPWLAFLCAGIVLGRLLDTPAWRGMTIGAGLALFGGATLLSGVLESGDRAVLASMDPSHRGLLYTMSALGTALVAFGAITAVAERHASSAAVDLLRRAGQMSLTLYIGHALVFNVLVDWFGIGAGGGLPTALVLAGAYWLVAIAAGASWHRRFGIGPAEWIYRRLSA